MRGAALDHFIDTATGPDLRAHVEHMRQVFDRIQSQDPDSLEPVTTEVQRLPYGPKPTVVPTHLAGSVLRALRLSLGFSTLDVEKATGVKRAVLDRIEHDRYQVATVGKLTRHGAPVRRASPYYGARETLLTHYNSCLT